LIDHSPPQSPKSTSPKQLQSRKPSSASRSFETFKAPSRKVSTTKPPKPSTSPPPTPEASQSLPSSTSAGSVHSPIEETLDQTVEEIAEEVVEGTNEGKARATPLTTPAEYSRSIVEDEDSTTTSRRSSRLKNAAPRRHSSVALEEELDLLNPAKYPNGAPNLNKTRSEEESPQPQKPKQCKNSKANPQAQLAAAARRPSKPPQAPPLTDPQGRFGNTIPARQPTKSSFLDFLNITSLLNTPSESQNLLAKSCQDRRPFVTFLERTPGNLAPRPHHHTMSEHVPTYSTPGQQRHLRACMVCTILLPQSTFLQSGCPNCESALDLKGSPDSVSECTSSNYNGMIALMNPEKSWVGKWQRLEGYVPGMYAVQVIGSLPDDVIDAVRSAGLRYVPRDGRKEEGEEQE